MMFEGFLQHMYKSVEVDCDQDGPFDSLQKEAVLRVIGETVGAACFFAGIQWASKSLIKNHLPSFLKMKKSSLTQLPSYVTSTVHAAGIGLWSIYKIRYLKEGGKEILPFTFGYFWNDFIQETLSGSNNPSNYLHHLTGIALLSTALNADRAIEPFFSQVYLIELSTPFLNALWMARNLKNPNGTFTRASFILFATTFFLLRIVYFPFVLFFLLPSQKRAYRWMGNWGRMYGMYTLLGLQIFWFFKIIRMSWRKFISIAPIKKQISRV